MTSNRLRQIRGFFDDLLVDFPFETEADKQNFISLLLTPFVYFSIDGLAPFFLIDSPRPGSGKSLLAADVVGRLVTGWRLISFSLITDLSEFRKQLTTLIISGRQIILFDNIGHHVDNGVFARFLTEPRWSDRVLGVNQSFQADHKCLTIGTANNFSSSDEIARRILPIRLVPREEHPENRSDFHHPALVPFLQEMRPKFIAIVIDMVEQWKAAGCPRADIAFGSYEDWARTIGGILQHSGFEDFLSNRASWAELAASGEEEDISAFVDTWASQFPPPQQVEARELLDLVNFNSAFADVLTHPAANRSKILGKRIGKLKDQRIGNYFIRGRRSHGRTLWSLARTSLFDTGNSRKGPGQANGEH